MSKLDDVKAALAASLEAQQAQPDDPTIAASIAELETEIAQLETAEAVAEKLAAEAADKLAADKLAAEAAEKLAADKLAAEKLAADKLAAEAPPAPPVAYIDPRVIQPTESDHPSRLPPAARPHGLVPGNYRA